MLKDIRFGLRMMRKHSWSTAAIVLMLGLVIGMNAAIFSVIRAAIFRPLPVPHPEELVMLTDPDAFGMMDGVQKGNRYLLSFREFRGLRDHATSVSGLCASSLTLERWPIRISGGAFEEARGRMVSENYFSVLGVQPGIGRFFDAEPGPYAVISDDYWKRRFGRNPAVLGTPVRVYKTAVTIIGVAAPGFRGETVGQNPDVWLPAAMQPSLMGGADALSDDHLMWLHVFGRREPGVTGAAVQAEMNVLLHGMLAARKDELDQRIVVRPASNGVFAGRDAFLSQWTILAALAGLVLALACANIANLLLARAATRSREIAIRLSVGAARGQIVRQLLTESLLLAALGGSAGIPAAWAGGFVLTRMLVRMNDSLNFAPGIDLPAFAFTACVTLLMGLLFGLAPAVRATKRITAARQRSTFARMLAATQIALSLVLVIGAGLFLRTLWNLQAVPLGYSRDNLLLVEVDGLGAGYDGRRAKDLDVALADRIRAIPGVRSVTWSDHEPFSGMKGVTAIQVEDFTPRDVGGNNGIYGYTTPYDDRGANREAVGPEYFSAVGIPILLGRGIERTDHAGSPLVCVINEAFARRFFAGRSPVGKHVTAVFSDSDHRTMEIVGVAKNARDYSLRGRVEAKFYYPAQQDEGGFSFEMRTAGDPNALFPAVRSAIREVDPDLPVKQMQTLRQAEGMQNAQPDLIARLCTIFGSIALLLAASGIYGVLAHGVERRTNEIGIRMALGAGRNRIAGMIVRETGILVLAGAAVGIAAAAFGTRLIASQLYGFTGLDMATVALAVGILGLVALTAACVPAMRAARVDPMRALRHE